MTICTECNSVEGKIIYLPLEEGDVEVIETCGECGCDDGCIKHYDEDYGRER